MSSCVCKQATVTPRCCCYCITRKHMFLCVYLCTCVQRESIFLLLANTEHAHLNPLIIVCENMVWHYKLVDEDRGENMYFLFPLLSLSLYCLNVNFSLHTKWTFVTSHSFAFTPYKQSNQNTITQANSSWSFYTPLVKIVSIFCFSFFSIGCFSFRLFFTK